VYGLAFGVLGGALMIFATHGGDRWQDQAITLLEIAMITMLSCVAVSYVRQFIAN